MIYLDTSVLVACYTEEERSAEAAAIAAQQSQRFVSDLVVTEFGVAIARKIREGYLTPTAGAAVIGLFDAHVATLYGCLAIEPRHFLAARAMALTSSVPLRTLDALHSAICRDHGLDLATFDGRLAAASSGFGLRVVP